MRGTLEERFWAKVNMPDVEGTCWEWGGARTIRGYGKILKDGGRSCLAAHRVSWEIHNGPLPDGVLVCHHCDNPPCVRPDHLFVGSQHDNMQDKVSKGRHYYTPGETSPNAKLSNDQATIIRARYAKEHISQRALAIQYGVSHRSIRHIIHHITYQMEVESE